MGSDSACDLDAAGAAAAAHTGAGEVEGAAVKTHVGGGAVDGSEGRVVGG